jgi:hypothetical protein
MYPNQDLYFDLARARQQSIRHALERDRQRRAAGRARRAGWRYALGERLIAAGERLQGPRGAPAPVEPALVEHRLRG